MLDTKFMTYFVDFDLNMKKTYSALCAGLFMLCVCNTGYAVEINVSVTSVQGSPVPNIVVFAQAIAGEVNMATADANSAKNSDSESKLTATMDQIDRQFVPHILVVEKDTWVSFPNSDSVKHHVYSFSESKPFELKLYDGGSAQALQFENTGEVALGCNIHDWMLGYIFVVDTPWFAKTKGNGLSQFNLPDGKYEVRIWSPLLQGEDRSIVAVIDTQGNQKYSLQLQHPLLPSYTEYETADEFSNY